MSRLLKRLRPLLDPEWQFLLDGNPTVHRTYAGYWQKAAGAWVWYVVDQSGKECGSQWPLSELVLCDHVSVMPEYGHYTLIPD